MKPLNLHKISRLNKINVGNGVKLRPLDKSDAARILEILELDKNIRNKVTVASRFHTPEDIATEIGRYTKDPGLIRYTLLKENNPIGLISLWRDDGFWGAKNLDDYGFGYFLDPNERGKGLVSHAVKSLMDIVSENLRVNQFVAFLEDKNNESIAVLENLGFKSTDQTLIEPNKGWIERKYVKKL